jgi:glucosamine--fructose-6-phosphate aminotransferase (isomerizing)
MCGIFGVFADDPAVELDLFDRLGMLSERRGRDSSGILYYANNRYHAIKADLNIGKLIRVEKIEKQRFIIGHSRLITNGQADNQPVIRDGLAIIHNGIITNDEEYWQKSPRSRIYSIDTEAILDVAIQSLADGSHISDLYPNVSSKCLGSFSCAVIFPQHAKLVLMSNTGSLYIGKTKDKNNNKYFAFASERFFLESVECEDVKQVKGQLTFDIPYSQNSIDVKEYKIPRADLLPALGSRIEEEKKLIFPKPSLRRCTCCILPESMPFISFDSAGVCNYCSNYKRRNIPKPRAVLKDLLTRYQSSHGNRCIMPFSGGRDSSFALHLLVKEFGMQPVTMTYDWGMVTDLARRNISRMCGELGVENILIADDIENKRRNIKLNLSAWLKNPHLGMVNILMAGDKHFFRHIETIKKETGLSVNVWGMNPLEVTHFKAGFLGFAPDFCTKQVFYTGLLGQLKYHTLRAKEMFKNPAYINRSLWDTLSGEYFRSIKGKTDFYNLFDYWQWDEVEINSSLENYGWEKAVDTNSTWRIGDGTAAFYNYVYYTMAGFTEFDTFRSNQIREGQINRDQALAFVAEENQPRYQNIKWYLDAVGMNFTDVINVINNAPRVYQA